MSTYWHGYGTWPRSFPHLDCVYNRSLQLSHVLYGEGPCSEYPSPPYNLAKWTVVGHCWTQRPNVGPFCWAECMCKALVLVPSWRRGFTTGVWMNVLPIHHTPPPIPPEWSMCGPTHLICHMYLHPDWMTHPNSGVNAYTGYCTPWLPPRLRRDYCGSWQCTPITIGDKYGGICILPESLTPSIPHGIWDFMTYCPLRSVSTGLLSLIVTTVTIVDRLIHVPLHNGMWCRWGYLAIYSSPNGCDTPHCLLCFEWLVPPNSVQPMAPSETWCCLMDSGCLRLLLCAAPRPAHLPGLCGFYVAGALEGALPTAAPKEAWELFESVVGILSIVPPVDHTFPPGGMQADAPTIQWVSVAIRWTWWRVGTRDLPWHDLFQKSSFIWIVHWPCICLINKASFTKRKKRWQ